MRNTILLIILAVILVLILSVRANACGGMTQIDPPSLQLQVGPCDGPPESILDDIEEFLVIC